MIDFAPDAFDAVQTVFDDPSRAALAERLDGALDDLEQTPGAARFRRHRMQHDPALFWFSVAGSGETWTLLWEPRGDGVYVHYAGPGLV